MKRIGSDVRGELARFGPVGAMARIVETWTDAVGEAVARNAWPARVARDRTLHVATSSSAWAFELAQLAPQVLERLRERLADDAPVALRFAPGRIPEPARPTSPRATAAPRRPGAGEHARAAELAATIENEDLRKIVAKTAAASLAQGRNDRAVW